MNKKRSQDLCGQPEVVYQAALTYLTRREYAPQELRNRLLMRGADEEDVEAAVNKLLSNGWLSEERFAVSRIRQRRDFSRRGRVAIRAELRALGVDEQVTANALEEIYDEEAESEQLALLVSRALADLEQVNDPEQRLKKVRSLQRRLLAKGFPAAGVREATESFLNLTEFSES